MKLKFAGMLKGSLRGRLIICMLIVSLIPLLLADFVMYKGYIGIMHENVEKLTNANLEQTRTALDTWIDSYGDVIAKIYCLPTKEIRIWANKHEDYLKKYHNKSKEDFIKDCEKANAEFNKWYC